MLCNQGALPVTYPCGLLWVLESRFERWKAACRLEGAGVCFRATALKDAVREKSALGREEKDDEANWTNDSGVVGEWNDLRRAGYGASRAGGKSGDDDGEESIDTV